MNEQYAALITGLKLFKDYTTHGAQRLLDSGEVKQHAAGASLFNEGDPPGLITSWRVPSLKRRQGGRMAKFGFGAARANRGVSVQVRLSRGTGWLKRCVPNTLAVSLAIGLLCLFMCSSRAETYAQKDDPTKSRPEPTDAVLRERERRALIVFYEALGGPDWIERDFWGSDRPVGEWHGVTTDADGRVVQLTIYDNNLTGALSPAICQLERLHTLHLSFNKITGALPDGLGECRALKNLWLKGNKLTGRLPDPVAVLPKLEYLDVHANDLSGPLPTIWDTRELKIFRAEDNRISGALPAQLFRQPRLEQIFLHNNELTGTIPTSLSANLSALLLANNRLSGPVPEEMGRLKKLTDLRLNRNELSGPIPASLAGAASLQVLRLDHNRLVGSVPTGLAKRLMVFDASHNPGLEPAR